MKSLIICFSQTGNTRNVADRIKDGIIEAGGSCQITDLNDVNKETLADYDLVGLGCPVFYYREPFNIGQFMQDLPELNGKQWFAFCTHGSVLGLTLISMTEQLEKKGIVVIGSHHTYADGTLPFYPYPTVTTGHPDDQELQEAFEFGKAVTECSRAVAGGDRSCIKKPIPLTEAWVPDEIALLSRDLMDQAFPRLSINSDTCTQCEECQDACPVNGIDVTQDPPKIQDPCIYCWNCAKVCPTCSIETDWRMMVSMAPSNYARYIQTLKDAEARGEFRWHVDPDTMNYDDPLYMQREREIKNK